MAFGEPIGPERFGRFLLLRRMATGGMGEIHLAKLRGPGGFEKLMVIKRVLDEMSDRADFVDMFLSEARVAAKLSHRNIAQIFEMGRTEGRYYIAMELVLGRSLSELIKKLRSVGELMPPALVTDIAAQICDGLAYAHAAADPKGPLGVIHRDISPRNLLLSYAGEVKIIDFGIAKSRMSLQPTAAGVVKGKLGYMSPEQSAARRIDRRTDIFSLGVVLHELCTLVHPFVNDDPILTFDAIQRRDPEPMARFHPAIAPLDPIVARALAKDPNDRYSDCEAMRRDLHRLATGGALPPADESLREYVQRLFAAELVADQAATEAASSVSLASLATEPDASADESLADTPVVEPAAPSSLWPASLPLRPRAALAALAIAVVAAVAATGLNALGRRHGLSALPSQGASAGTAPVAAMAPVPVSAVEPPLPVTAPAPVEPAVPATAPDLPPAAPAPPPEEPPAGKRGVRRAVDSPPESPVLATLEVTTDPPVRIGRAARRGSARLPLRTGSGTINIGSGLDPAADPFRLRLAYRLDNGGAVFTLVAEPWAIAQNGIGAGLGRTPVTVSGGSERVVMMLTSPVDKRKLRLSLELR